MMKRSVKKWVGMSIVSVTEKSIKKKVGTMMKKAGMMKRSVKKWVGMSIVSVTEKSIKKKVGTMMKKAGMMKECQGESACYREKECDK
jgi:RNA polymerase subunit RPABC4/transcription elongation factor Spt4